MVQAASLAPGSTRQRIVEVLRRQGRSTVVQLAEALGIVPASVRRHLDILQRDGLVSLEQVRRATGRPHYVFFLTEDGREQAPKDYSGLAALLLEELSAMSRQDLDGQDGNAVVEKILNRLADRIIADCAQATQTESLEERARILADVLNRRYYSTTLEVEDGELVLISHNCPFQRVAAADCRVCDMDLRVYREVLGVDVRREQTLAAGGESCVYLASASSGRLRWRGER